MLITCLRHATAEPQTFPEADAERTLVRKGREQVLRVAEFCRQHDLMPATLYSSQLLRARQTAILLQAHLPDCPSVQIADWLTLGAEPQDMLAKLQKLDASGANDVWLVGHEPDISAFLSHLLAAPNDCILIKKASLTRIEVEFSASIRGQLLWSIPCALMR